MSNTFWRKGVLDLVHMRVRLDWDGNTRTVAAHFKRIVEFFDVSLGTHGSS